jgi:hypothetical protein
LWDWLGPTAPQCVAVSGFGAGPSRAPQPSQGSGLASAAATVHVFYYFKKYQHCKRFISKRFWDELQFFFAFQFKVFGCGWTNFVKNHPCLHALSLISKPSWNEAILPIIPISKA